MKDTPASQGDGMEPRDGEEDVFLGLDTSNYRTSLALVSAAGEVLLDVRELLPVPPGGRGLRQSDAVYAHLKRMKTLLPNLETAMVGRKLRAVCASTKPRNQEDSYMPVFEVGETLGRGIAAAEGIPFFASDHQHGHLRAARLHTSLERIPDEVPFLGLHLSGGTTDLLLRRGEALSLLGTSLDLHAGQLVDRVGVALGCGFPAGPELESLALRGESQARLPCSMEKGDMSCHLSGAEAQARRWIQQGAFPPEEIAWEVFDLLARTAARMLAAGARETGCDTALVFGGIASSGLFRQMLTFRAGKIRKGLEVVFGDPALSGDNAAGIAMIGRDKWLAFRG